MSVQRPLVVVVDEQNDTEIDAQRWAALAEASLVNQGVPAGELNLLFVDEPQMAQLNHEHMAKTGPTDVLSFPLDGADASDPDSLIGDIIVCPSYAARNAPEHAGDGRHRGTLDDELALLVVHGVLHILGHDHIDPAEAEVMESLEQDLLAAFHS